VDSSVPPPPPSFQQRKLRPWYLVTTMGLVWIIGLYSLMSACAMVAYLREGSMADVEAERKAAEQRFEPYQVVVIVWQTAHLRSVSEHQHVTFPLHVAKLLLSGLLVIASGLAMRGRRGARTLALQALAANAVLALADYMLTRNVRSTWIEAVAHTRELLPRLTARPSANFGDAFWGWMTTRSVLWWYERIRFVLFDLGALMLAAFALTRAKTKVFFDAVARAAEQAEEP
jgi:hypothetical protein